MRSSQRWGVPAGAKAPLFDEAFAARDPPTRRFPSRALLQLSMQLVPGRSGDRLSISLLWLVLFYGWTASEIYVAIATRTRRGHGKRLDRGSMAILWVTILASISVAEWIAGTSPHNMFGGA